MATITKGKTFISGETVEPADMHQLVDQATISFVTADDTDDSTLEASGGKLRVKDAGVTDAKLATGAVTGAAGGGKLAASAITGQTQLADPLASGDEFLVHDTSASALRRVAWSALQPAGSVLQTVQVVKTTLESCSTLIPADDTIPQNTEGNEVFTASITPSSSGNKILIRVTLHGNAPIGSGFFGCAVFKDSDANAIAAAYEFSDTGNYSNLLSIEYLHSPSTTSAITYKVRAGASSGIYYLNGRSGGTRLYGGAAQSNITLQEIKG